MAGVGEPVATPERLEIVAHQPPGAQDGVARVVGDHHPAARIPGRRVGLGAERQPADLHRAHRLVVVAARPPEPHGVRRLARAEHRAIGVVAPVVHPEDVLVGDHGVPAVAAPGCRPVGGLPLARRSSAARRRGRAAAGTRRSVPTAITLSPSDSPAARSTARGAAAAAPPAAASRDRAPRRSRARGPAGASQSFVTSSPPSSTTKELCGRGTGSRWEASTSRSGAEAMDPAAEDHVQVAVRVCGHPAGPVRAAGQPGGGCGDRERLGVEPLDPALDRSRQRPADGHVVAQRVQLPGLAPQEHVGAEGVDGGGDLEALAGPDPEAGHAVGAAAAQRPAVLAGPRARPVGAGHQ